MMKQVIQIAVFTVLTVLLLTAIAVGQDVTYRDAESETEMPEGAASEEIMELIYKYDMPDQQVAYEEIGFDRLPEGVKNSFRKGPHKAKTITKVFEMANEEKPSTYVIFMENKGRIEKFHFNEKGKHVEETPY